MSSTIVDYIKIGDGGVRPLIENVFGNLLSYLRSDTNVLNLTVEVDREKLQEFFLNATASLKVCEAGVDPFADEEVNCRSPDKSNEEFLDEVLNRKNVTVLEGTHADLATVYNLGENSEGRVRLEEIREWIKIFKIVLYSLVGLLFLVILLIYLVKKDSPRRFLRVVGIDFLIACVLIFIVGVFVYSTAGNLLVGKNELIVGIATYFINALIYKGAMWNFVLLFAAVALIASSFVIKEKFEI